MTFNGTAATATSWSDTSITVAVPAGATTGDLVVTVGGEASEGVEFTVTPSISSLSPDTGPVGASVEITGTSFGASQETSTVTFNGTAATATSWSATSITVAVPAGATTGDVVVTVGGEASEGVEFTVTPAVSSLSPDTGPVGASVEITGTSFGAAQGTSTVSFNGTVATPTSWSDTSITVTVPSGAATGNVVVTVGGQASNGVAFTVKPAISSLSPDSGPVATSVEITGTSFGATQGTSTVTFNGTAATASSWSATSITVAVPAGAATGPVVVTVDSQASNGVAFTVTPAISSLSPDTGPVETTVEITGTSFGATQGTGTVTFNGIAATASSWDATSITVTVPVGATTGPVVVTVDGEASNGLTFTVRENRAPEVEQTIAAQTVNRGASLELTVSSYFSDPDEDDLEYTASSSDTAKVTVAVDGAVATLSGVAKGDATVTVTAGDGDLTAQQSFTVTVPNGAPATVGSVSAQTVNKGANLELTVSSYFSDPDGDDLEYTAVSSDTAKVTVAVDGAVVTLSGVAKGDATVTVTASDGSLTAQQAFSVTVPNSAPEAVGTIGPQTVNKGANLELTVSSYFSDPDGDDLEYTAVSSDTAKVTVAVDGAVATLSGVAKGDATVTVTASDGSLTTQQAFSVTVPNGAPATVGSVSAQTVNKGASSDLTVSSYFSDPDGDDLEYTAVSSDTARVTVAVDGAVVTLSGVAKGDATVTVTASDGSLTTQQAFSVTVPNSAPVCSNIPEQILWVNDDLRVNLSVYCSDPDGDPLTYTASSSRTSKVTESVRGSTLTLTGKALGSSTITVTARDNPGDPQDSLSTTETFTATVKNRNPVCTFSSQTLDEDQSKDLGVTAHCTDGDGHSMTYTAASSSNSNIVSVERRSNNTVVRITGESAGTATVEVTVADGHEGSTTKSFSVRVRPPSPTATLDADSTSIVEGQCTNLNWTTTSAVSASINQGVGTVTPTSGGSKRVCPSSTTKYTLTATGRTGAIPLTDTDSVTVRVRPPSPVINSFTADSTSIVEGQCTNLNWTTEHAASGSIDGVAIASSDLGSGSKEVCPSSTTTYTLTATGRTGAIPLTDTDSVTVTVRPPSPVINSFTADSTSIVEGECTTLRWMTTHAASGSINGVAIARSDLGTGSKEVCPSSTTTYTLTATGRKGAIPLTATAIVPVTPRPPSPVTKFFRADSTSIVEGECTTLRWMTTHAASGSIDGVAIASSDLGSGSKEVCPSSTTTYTLTATGRTGAIPLTDTDSVTVTVRPPSPVIKFFRADSTSIVEGECTTLRWMTTHAASGSINGVAIASPDLGSGSKEVCPSSTTTYTLTATGRTKADPLTATASVTVTVRPPSPVINSFTADSTSIVEGECTTLRWMTTHAVSGSIDGVAIASPDLGSGSKEVCPSSTTTYTLTATGRTKSDPLTATASVTVRVRPPSPVINSFTADSTSIVEGDCTNLNWTTTNAVSASINQGVGTVTPTAGGSTEVCPGSTTTYTLTATGRTGADPLTATASVTVTVSSTPSSPSITSISPSLQRPDDPVTIYGNHFGSTAGSVSFGGHSISTFSGQGYSWSNTSISLLIPGSLYAGQVSVSVTTSGGSTSTSYSYTVTGGPVSRGHCGEGDEDCQEGKKDKQSGDSDEGGTDEDSAEGGG